MEKFLSNTERIKREGGTLWFIERKDNNKWFYYNKDGWTNSSLQAQGYITKKDAHNAAFSYCVTNQPIENLMVSEHCFEKVR